MVRSPGSALTVAINNTTRRPIVHLMLEDHVVHYALYHTPGTLDSWHDVCLAADGSIVRVHLTPDGSGFVSDFCVQRITDPTEAGQWAAWDTLPGSEGIMYLEGGCAVVNSGGVLYAFAQRATGGNQILAWSSIDNGLIWSGPVVVVDPPGGSLLSGVASAGNDDVFFLYAVTGGVALGCSFLVDGSWSTLASWTMPPLFSGLGLAVAWDGTAYTIIYSDGYSLDACVFHPVLETWTPGVTIAPSTNTAIARISPRLSFTDGLYTLTCIEADSGLLTGAVYHYPRLRQSVDLFHWSDGVIVPDLVSTYGAVAFTLVAPLAGIAEPRYYLSTLPAVYSAPMFQEYSSSQNLDVSPAVLSYQREEVSQQAARLEITLDNAQGIYNDVIMSPTYGPLGLHTTFLLSEGYYVAGEPMSPQVMLVGRYYLEYLRVVRSPYENHLVLVGFDLSHRLDRVARYQYNYNARTVGFLVRAICARAGLFMLTLPVSEQIEQIVPFFTLQAGQVYRTALDELCATYGLVYRLDQDEVLHFLELSAEDDAVWSYQPEIEQVSFGEQDVQANHIIVHGKPPLGGNPGALTSAELHDVQHLRDTGVEQVLFHVDTRLTMVTQCELKAAFLLAQQRRKRGQHIVTVPLNPALQTQDVITLIDSIAPSGSGLHMDCRITKLEATYHAGMALAHLRLTLEHLA